MYQKVSTNLNFVDREKKTEQFWKENHIFEKSMEQRKQGETYTFYDGPPTANGKPHIGHVLTRVIKDMIPRYRTMNGYSGAFGMSRYLERKRSLSLPSTWGRVMESTGEDPYLNGLFCESMVKGFQGDMMRMFFHVGFLDFFDCLRTHRSDH